VDKVTFLTGFNMTGQDTFMYVAVDKGWFGEVGIEVAVQAGSGTDKNLALLLAGAAQFATIDMAGAIIATMRQPFPDFRCFATIYQRSVSCLVALPQAGIAAPQDLAGRQIGYFPGGVNYSLFPAYARQCDLDPNTVRWQPLAPQLIRPALLAGQIDAAVEIVVGRPAVEEAARTAGKLGAGEQVAMLPYADVLRDVIGNAIGCTAETARNNPDLVRRFRDAALRGLAWTLDNPDDAGAIMARHNPSIKAEVAAAEVRETIPYIRAGLGVLGYVDPARVSRCIALVQGLGLVPSGVTTERVLALDLQPGR
jgi:NitT/TauT family transport system substrate-binding protein